jgi:hypothetical protein
MAAADRRRPTGRASPSQGSFNMFRHPVRGVSRLTVVGGSFLTLAFGLCAAPRIAVADEGVVTLDDFTTTAKDGGVITIKHAEFQGTNLSKDEIVKLLTPDTTADDETALLQKAKFAAISIPLIDIAPKKGGAIHVHGVTANDIDAGKIGKFAIASIDGAGTDDDGPVSVKAGAFLVENADLTDALASAKDPKSISPMSHLGHLALEGVDFTVPDKEAGPGKSIHIAMGSLDVRNNYDGETFKDGVMKLKSLAIEPSAGSEFANNLAILGFKRLELSANVSARYDEASKKLSLEDFTLDAANAGAFSVKASFGDIEPALFGPDAEARMGAVAGGSVSSVEVKYVNAGLFEKAVAYFAGQQKVAPEAVKTQWAAAAGQMLPAVLGGDPSALKIASEAQKFIAAPTNMTITVHPKSGSFKFADAMAISDPMAVIGALEIVAVANK